MDMKEEDIQKWLRDPEEGKRVMKILCIVAAILAVVVIAATR